MLGFFVGVLPGAGPTISTFFSYAVEKKISRRPEEFGHGAIEGVAGPESANNAAATGAMVPMLTLGIPGSATTAIMLGGLMMWGLRPGPLLFEKNPQFVWGLIASQYIANVMLLVLSTAFIPLFVRALRVPFGILMPIIIIFCVTGAYSLKNSVFDVGQMLVFGVLGYAHEEARLLARGADAGAGARAARRAGAAPVADHLRQRHRDLLHAADLGRARRRRAGGGRGAGAARRAGRAPTPRSQRSSRLIRKPAARSGRATPRGEDQAPMKLGFLFSMNAACPSL